METQEMQLDLFTHNRNAMLRNDVIAALRRRDEAAGRETLALLSAEYPNDSLLKSMAELLDTLIAPQERFSDHGRVAEELHTLDTVIAPSAKLVFAPEEARAWLAPVWRSLASCASRLSFDAEQPHTHAASMLLHAGDWCGAEAQVNTIVSWRRIPAPLAWMAEARFHQGGVNAAWCLLVELAWIHASSFILLVRRLEAPALRKLLHEFEAAFESDDEADLAWFPAWALIAEPALAVVLRQTHTCGNTAPERGARLIMELLALERQGRHAELIAQRKRLRDLHPRLFGRYMATR